MICHRYRLSRPAGSSVLKIGRDVESTLSSRNERFADGRNLPIVNSGMRITAGTCIFYQTALRQIFVRSTEFGS